MKYIHRRYFLLVYLTVVGVVVSGCATGANGRGTKRTPKTGTDKPATVTYKADPNATLGTVVRHVGEQTKGGLVLMNGFEWREALDASFTKMSLGDVAQKIAEAVGGVVQDTGDYYFIYPAQYAVLENVSLAGMVAPKFDDIDASIAFGSGTPIYSIFANLGRTLNTTLVADNYIAQWGCGELSLPEMPLPHALAAVLKSARIPQQAFEVISTDEFVFIRWTGAPAPENTLLNEADLDDARRAMLDKVVTVELPEPQPQGKLEVYPGATTLELALPSLGQQLGIRVTAEPELARLPVNPATFSNVTVRTVMDLLIRQWLVPDYGYTVEADRIVIRHRPEG